MPIELSDYEIKLILEWYWVAQTESQTNEGSDELASKLEEAIKS